MTSTSHRNLEYGVYDIAKNAYDCVFSDMGDAFLWRNSEEKRELFEVRRISTGMRVKPEENQERKLKRRNLST